MAAVTLQSAIVWDYGLCSDRTAGQIIRAMRSSVRGQRIVTLLVTLARPVSPNPLLHAENWLGVDTGNIIWNNYETLHYYFPVQFRPGSSGRIRATSSWCRCTKARPTKGTACVTGSES